MELQHVLLIILLSHVKLRLVLENVMQPMLLVLLFAKINHLVVVVQVAQVDVQDLVVIQHDSVVMEFSKTEKNVMFNDSMELYEHSVLQVVKLQILPILDKMQLQIFG